MIRLKKVNLTTDLHCNGFIDSVMHFKEQQRFNSISVIAI